MDEGFIYCITNPAVRYLSSEVPGGLVSVKIGYSSDPERRIRDFSTPISSEWTVVAMLKCPFAHALELAMHSFLHTHPFAADFRIAGYKGECYPFPKCFVDDFFRVTGRMIESALDELPDFRCQYPPREAKDATKTWYVQHIKRGWHHWQELAARSASDALDLGLVDRHPDDFWDWSALSLHSHLTVEFVEKHVDRPWNWGWDGLSARDDLFSPEYIAAHPEHKWEIVPSVGKWPVAAAPSSLT